MPPFKQNLKHGQKISCEIDGVKIADANANKMRNGNLYIEYDEGFIVIFDEDLTSDKYKIRLVEEEKGKTPLSKILDTLPEYNIDTEVITVKRWGTLNHNGLMLGTFKHKDHAMFGKKKGLIPVELTISYYLPKPKEITVEEAENLLGGKYKII